MAVDYGKYTKKIEGGDFARTIDWNEEPEFEGTYNGPVERVVKGETRTFQTFTDLEGNDVEAWGTAILDSRLKAVPAGSDVLVVYLGKNAKTKRGVLAHNFDVFVAEAG